VSDPGPKGPVDIARRIENARRMDRRILTPPPFPRYIFVAPIPHTIPNPPLSELTYAHMMYLFWFKRLFFLRCIFFNYRLTNRQRLIYSVDIDVLVNEEGLDDG
jgi:hypothetical protein